MESFKKTLEYYDRIWRQVERLLPNLLLRPDGESPPDVKELSAIVTVLKRAQDAHRAILLDAIKIQEPSTDAKAPHPAEKNDPMDDQEISRILTLLEESNGEEEDPDQKAM